MKITLDGIERSEALRYMGHRGEVSTMFGEIVENCEKRLLETISPNFIFRVFDIEANDQGVDVKGSSLVLHGEDIKNHLDGCGHAVLMCATLGTDTDRLIRMTEINDISSAFVMDALASAAIEDVCRKADIYIKEQMPEKFFTWRFSPGYGDFPIDIQKDFLEVLDAPKRVGVCTGENNILIPRKSVTSVAGVSESPVPRKRRGCACCNMVKSCTFRERGEHCGF